MQRQSMLKRFGSVAAVALLSLSATVAVAQTAAPAPSQAPGFYRFRVGSFVATTVWDDFAPRQNPGRGWIVNADQAAVEGALRDAMLSTARLLGQTTGAALVGLVLARAGEHGPVLALWLGAAAAVLAAGVSSLRLLTRRRTA